MCPEGQTQTLHSHQHPHVRCCPASPHSRGTGCVRPSEHPGYMLVSAVGRGCDISNTHPLGGLPASSHSSFPAPSTCGLSLRVVTCQGVEAREATGRGVGLTANNQIVSLCAILCSGWGEEVNKTTPSVSSGDFHSNTSQKTGFLWARGRVRPSSSLREGGGL